MISVMSTKSYNYFIKADSTVDIISSTTTINGEEAKRLYLEEIRDLKSKTSRTEEKSDKVRHESSHKRKKTDINNKELYLAAQNNDVDVVKDAINEQPERLNNLDEYGWSLLMIACQGNCFETVQLLLEQGADTSIRDKAGNSAMALVIKNKNAALADLFLSKKQNPIEPKEAIVPKKTKKKRLKEEYQCELCNVTCRDKYEHLTSTVHNINASRDKKVTTCYKIPMSNKGYQIMLRRGWDKDSGLGVAGNGRQYPIRVKEKKDRKGLGHREKKETNSREETAADSTLKTIKNEYYRSKRLETNFRREFY